jgi:DNA mismatch endonuclease, patch repair protein
MARSPEIVSRGMRAVKSSRTAPELRLFGLLRCLPVPIQFHPKSVLGNPDFLFPAHRVVVFLDGDFWHGRQWKLRGFSTLNRQFSGISNADYWRRKIARNLRRDRRVSRWLRSQGWSVLRIWESDLNKNPEACLAKVVRALHRANEKRS